MMERRGALLVVYPGKFCCLLSLFTVVCLDREQALLAKQQSVLPFLFFRAYLRTTTERKIKKILKVKNYRKCI
ncbi:hypothetical protein F5X96DRAFT_640826 [Biscogniauxia mediterranea]|nr:hypothetical protein F5X96DRAFT_640826 [Biscogniauxia mediterranea]